MNKNLDVTKPQYNKQILPVPWPFIISRFYCITIFLFILEITKTNYVTLLLS